MAILKKDYEKPRIDISGPDGNAYVLIGYARDLAKQLKLSKGLTDIIIKTMKSDDYENLLKVFDKYFGDYVDLIR